MTAPRSSATANSHVPKRSRSTGRKKAAPAGAATTESSRKRDVEAVLAWLKRQGTKSVRDGMARFAIPSDRAFGVSVGAMRQHAKRLGQDHGLATALWDTGWYEARMMALFLAEPARVTAAQMDCWAADFDNWAVCDTACFHLFDHTPHAWRKVAQWSARREEFVKRAGFALLWALSVHDKAAGDERFTRGLQLIERSATDERHFVKKSINMALRAIGKRNRSLNAAATATARRLASSSDATARWIGKDALRELTSAAVSRRLAGRPRRLATAKGRPEPSA